MYMCWGGIDFARFYNFLIGFWNCFDGVLFFCFSFYYMWVIKYILF